MNNDTKFVFFGTPEFAIDTLEELKKAGFIPALIITAPDRPAGRGQKLTPPPVKIWAEKNKIQFLQPENLDKNFSFKLSTFNFQLAVVASYGKILPKEILEISEHSALNVHPSLLPRHRGASPVVGTILSGDRQTGVTIMLMDEKMDHGPILSQETIQLDGDEKASTLEKILAGLGGELLVKTIPSWIHGELQAQEQDHNKATFTNKIKKEDGLINLDDDPELNWRKFRAYDVWPGTYFFATKGGKKIRVIIKDAKLEDKEFKIKKVLPEGRKEMNYEDFLRNLK